MRSKGPNPIDVLVGARIRVLRKRRKMSQAALGEALGVTFQQVQKYENGKNRVGASRLHLVATALDVPISEFFANASEMSRSSVATKAVAFDPRALRLAEAFTKITDKQLRSSLVDLVETMARKPPAAEHAGLRFNRAGSDHAQRQPQRRRKATGPSSQRAR